MKILLLTAAIAVASDIFYIEEREGQILYEEAKVDFEKKDYKAAVVKLEKFLRNYKKHHLYDEVCYLLILAFYNLKEYEQLPLWYKKLKRIKNSPYILQAEFILTDALIEQERYKEALKKLYETLKKYKHEALEKIKKKFQDLYKEHEGKKLFEKYKKKFERLIEKLEERLIEKLEE